MIFNKVTFTNEDFSLKMTPIKYYNTQVSVLRVYVTYKISLKILETNKSIDTQVHYYLSDGKTNTLRANLFYPFLYFDIKKNTQAGLFDTILVLNSTMHLSDELIVKLATIKNVDFKIVEKSKETYKEDYEQNFLNHLVKQKKQKYEIDSHHGIFNILSRFRNIVDLILAVTCTEVINFKYEDAMKDHDYVKYRPKSDEEKETYDMNDYKKLSEDEKSDQPFKFDDYMRLQKLKELQQLRNEIMRAGELVITPIELDVNSTQYETFNRYIGVMYEHIFNDPPLTLSIDFKTRVQDYNDLSKVIAIKLYTITMSLSPPAPFILEPEERVEWKLLDYLRRGWYIENAYKKYLKYKAKYLKLKQYMKLS